MAGISQVGVAVIGVGSMGRRHAENLQRVPGARLVAVVDANVDLARDVATGLGVDSFHAEVGPVLERKGVQAVVIASPSRFHASTVQAAAAAGKHILCEKPMATSLEEADAAIAAAERSGVCLQVGHMRRYDPAYAEARQRIEDGEIGRPVIFKSIGRDRELPPMSYFRSGGMLFLESSIHDFDLARWLVADEIVEVQAFGGALATPELAQYGDVDCAVVNLRFAGGAIGNVESYRQAGYGYDVRTEIVGSKGTLAVGYPQNVRDMRLTAENAADGYLTRFADAYASEIRDFIMTVREGRPPQVTGRDGRSALAVSLAAERSYREGRPVAVTPATQ
jgi:inositol 2-dehydrogenase